MCGIAGYVGKGCCEDILVDFLETLEYRGYDSSGIAVKIDDEIVVTKGACRIGNLKQCITTKTINSLGIGHTRWATHGGVESKNAHPHLSNNGDWCIVHNGIINNYLSIKNELCNNGIKFDSDTDSEVVAQVLENEKVTNIEGFISCVSKLKGSYAICAINNKNNIMYLARYESPLYVGVGINGVFVASDILCFEKYCTKYCVLENNEYCEIVNNNIVCYDNKCNAVDKNFYNLDLNTNCVNRLNFDTFMEKEINEIPQVFQNIIKNYNSSDFFSRLDKYLKRVKRIDFVACGTSYHSGLIGASYLQKKLGIPCNTYIASEFLYSAPIINKDALYIFISQSGETADTLRALEMVKSQCLAVVVLTNVLHSTMARLADVVLPVFAGPEMAVASTKAYNAQVLVLYLLSEYFSGKLTKTKFEKIKNNFKNFNIKNYYKIKECIDDVEKLDAIFVLGKYRDYYTAMEASLKIREITYINCSALPSGELKHGTLALISPKSLSFVIITNSELVQKSINAINEIKARGGKVALITQLDLEDRVDIDYLFKLDNIDEDLIDLVSVIPFQLFACLLSCKKGINPDKPRNLAKSVTVE